MRGAARDYGWGGYAFNPAGGGGLRALEGSDGGDGAEMESSGSSSCLLLCSALRTLLPCANTHRLDLSRCAP